MKNKNTTKTTSSSFFPDSTSLLIIPPTPPPQEAQGRAGGGGQFLTRCLHHSLLLTVSLLHAVSLTQNTGQISAPTWAAKGQLNTALFSESRRGIRAPLSRLSFPSLFPLTPESAWLFLSCFSHSSLVAAVLQIFLLFLTNIFLAEKKFATTIAD